MTTMINCGTRVMVVEADGKSMSATSFKDRLSAVLSMINHGGLGGGVGYGCEEHKAALDAVGRQIEEIRRRIVVEEEMDTSQHHSHTEGAILDPMIGIGPSCKLCGCNPKPVPYGDPIIKLIKHPEGSYTELSCPLSGRIFTPEQWSKLMVISTRHINPYELAWRNHGLPDIDEMVHGLNCGGFRLIGSKDAVEYFKAEFAKLRDQQAPTDFSIDVDKLSNYIRQINGGNTMGAGALDSALDAGIHKGASASSRDEINRKIRASVDDLLRKAGFAEDASVRHQLAMMDFSEQAVSVARCAICGSASANNCNDLGCGYLESGNGVDAR